MDTATYQKKISDYFSASCIQMALHLAKEVGILNILFSAEQPLTTTEIAQKGNLKERYVRELLGALATSEIIHVDSTSTKYDIPETHKQALRVTSAYSTLGYQMASKMETMKDIFNKDGPEGSPSDDAAFDAMEERRLVSQDSILDNDILPCIPEVKQQLEKGIHVSEFGCAQGILLLNFAARYPKSTFVGSDISERCIHKARQVTAERGLTNITFQVYDLYNLPQTLNNQFDWIYVRDVLHDLPSPGKALKAMKPTLKKDGTASFIDFGMRGSLADYTGDMQMGQMFSISTFLCVPASFTDKDSDAFGSCWSVKQVRQLLNEAEFTITSEVFRKKDSSAVHYVCKV